MDKQKPNKESAYRKYMDIMLGSDKSTEQFRQYYDYIDSTQPAIIRLELPTTLLVETKYAKAGRFTARKDQPHFQGDEYHGHCDVGGGHEVAWNMSASRRHPNKFPAQIPNDAKAAVAKVLDLSPDLLEAFWIEEDGMKTLLVEGKRK